MRFSWRFPARTAAVFAGASLMIGCSVAHQSASNPVQPPTPTPSSAAFTGVIHGGQNPVGGASVYLLEASRTGYGQPSTSVITNPSAPGVSTGGVNNWNYVTTRSDGTFTIPGTAYQCDQGFQVYLYSVGGNAGFGTNTAIGLMAALGECGASSSFSNLPSVIQMNEVTTVVAAYALAGFATDATDISSSNTSLALTGIANASLNARSLVDLGTGLALATTTNGGVVPQEMIYTVANILAACINSATPNSGGCDTLRQNATSDGTGTGAQPGDTATAAINIAHHPGANVAALFGTITTTPPFLFSPQLTQAPTDFAIGIGYSGGGLTSPTAIAIDAGGNAWVTDTPAPGTAGAVILLGPQGTILSGSSGYACTPALLGPAAIALGPSTLTPETAWVLSTSANITGVPDGGGTCTALRSPEDHSDASGWNNPISIAAGSQLFVLDQGQNNLDEFDLANNSSATWAANWQGIFSNPPDVIALDGAGNIWVADLAPAPNSPSNIYAINSTGHYIASNSAPLGLSTDFMAVGANQSLWMADSGNDDAIPFSTSVTINSATATEGTPFTDPTGGIGGPLGVAVDGVGNAWVLNLNGADIAAFSADGMTALSPDGTAPNTAPFGGYSGNGIVMPSSSSPTGIAVDPSGDVWVSVQYGSSPVVQFIGMAAPTVTPLADAVAGNKIAKLP